MQYEPAKGRDFFRLCFVTVRDRVSPSIMLRQEGFSDDHYTVQVKRGGYWVPLVEIYSEHLPNWFDGEEEAFERVVQQILKALED